MRERGSRRGSASGGDERSPNSRPARTEATYPHDCRQLGLQELERDLPLMFQVIGEVVYA
jgi:hypothetical protein